MKHISITLVTIILISIPGFASETLTFRGEVLDIHTGNAIPGVEIFTATQGTVTDENGQYQIELDLDETVTVRCIGYEPISIAVEDIGATLLMRSKTLEGESIHVEANRAIPGISPVAYSRLEASEIRKRYSVEDVPMVLSSEPGVHAYSESGNGTGYSYVSIRGFDQSRIAVMIDNVPLNDNESHQVYWVDHGDILSSAEDVEIQRGIGSSLYGANAFGGSININTGIRSETESMELGVLRGSYNTEKYHASYRSGKRFGENFSLAMRASLLNSDGYRVDSRSEQQSFMLSAELRRKSLVNQFRAIIGKEYSILQWDGVSKEYLDDPELRRTKMSWTVPFTDDYLQQIYSLNSHYMINERSVLRNVAYVVTGRGFYEVDKFGQDYFSYNLDVNNEYPDSIELAMETDFTRRKWINNIYYGVTPTYTLETKSLRSDVGLEIRNYSGDHFGEVINVSDSLLATKIPAVYEYYSYLGNKSLVTLFGHMLYQMGPHLTASLDVRAQWINWELDQASIGNAPGVNLNASWQLFNPRVGLQYQIRKGFSAFISRGSASREPADAQIIEADDVWSTPQPAETEQVINTEFGINWFSGQRRVTLNLYRIDFQNELLSDIYDFQDGGFNIETADLTLHQGVELDLQYRVSPAIELNANASIAEHRILDGGEKANHIANVPGVLGNMQISYEPLDALDIHLSLKHVGKQYIDSENTEDLAIPAYSLVNLMTSYEWQKILVSFKVNNLLNAQYATYGYSYYGGYYWPGATRNISLAVNYSF
ncbi:MAG: TonB-dependent receptor [Candidatus Marinimicrobia bacterium]|nr:TonB-dependent receptor [Candidatus Neomarinimicrobiota bacterium]MCF7851414.1 TonB-dependent receptor [Candidatus Neomarinimicrobiota bacterium]MCF7905325.1 TonB-dependent receptor [Candidatus Neomarinimicrobiota bacterium]